MQFSNIQVRVNVNPKGWVSGKNVIYNRKNSDGSIDKVERVWHVYGGHIERGPANTCAIRAATARELPTLTQFISQKDKTSRLARHNTHLGGSLHCITRIPQPIVKTASQKVPATKPKPAAPALSPQQVTATIQLLDQQVKKLTTDIVNLNKQLAADRKDKEQLRLELVKTQAMLAKTQNENAVIKAALQILMNR